MLSFGFHSAGRVGTGLELEAMGLRIQAEHWLLSYPWRVSEQGLAVGVRSQASVRIWGGEAEGWIPETTLISSQCLPQTC